MPARVYIFYHVPQKIATETPAAERQLLRAETASAELKRNPRRERLRRRRVFYALERDFASHEARK